MTPFLPFVSIEYYIQRIPHHVDDLDRDSDQFLHVRGHKLPGGITVTGASRHGKCATSLRQIYRRPYDGQSAELPLPGNGGVHL